MPRMPITLALCTLLSSAPVVAPNLALAEPAGPDRAAQAAPPSRSPTDTGTSTTSTTTVQRNAPAPTQGIESITPVTPMPLNLPDEAKASEVKSEYAIGIASLIIGGVLLAALVLGVLFIVTRRSWSTTH